MHAGRQEPIKIMMTLTLLEKDNSGPPQFGGHHFVV